ncbi:MAG: hypothetical protein EOP83_17185 [Verrucomicrobiaceae bacterium]|nr:MAG: hypothetical protein EOP83_17185 [Verrucomicrobiaceae bacterium]
MKKKSGQMLMYPYLSTVVHTMVSSETRRDIEEHLPYTVNNSAEYRDTSAWCSEYLGPSVLSEPHDYTRRWARVGTTMHFRLADDAFAYKMRWG